VGGQWRRSGGRVRGGAYGFLRLAGSIGSLGACRPVHNPFVITTRPIRRDQLEDWIAIGAADPANERLADRVRGAWADGSGRPELTFVAQDAILAWYQRFLSIG